MSASQNSNAVKAAANAGQAFTSKVPPSEPLQTGGHKPGVQASPNDRAPEFSAQTHPPGTAPASSTYTPNPDLNNQGTYTSASSTLGGATSADVHTGLGHPGQGQTSSELQHDGQHHRKKQGLGLAGLSNEVGDGPTQLDPRAPDFANQRNLGDVPSGQRGNVGGSSAQEREPETAETLARESRS
ncbi:hypothetical protein B0J11DRAFT_271233 [Dendryphion nanum]|uniref:Uncharacterized protein n=1 Tax=Dendryphion nanum TaxID=256645 RepID=A0A9P9DXV4_9PLEO|nr:hypothetical protein B0J11DRAFT_271233 [Dendryphion nanum]